MCGIAGFVNDARETVLTGMLKRIAHRGPDGSGHRMVDRVGLGNVRLSIIDQKGGGQPMTDASGRYTVVYNGELYGYRRIRDQLIKDGVSLRSACDTELLLPLYRRYGADMFGHLNGMFAFVLYDKEEERLVIARDHLGIKPLIYTRIGTSLYFSSEIKSLYAVPEWNATPDFDAWHTFLNVRFPPSPHTLFNDVWKLPPGCYMVVQPKGRSQWANEAHELVREIDLEDKLARVYRYYVPHAAATSVQTIEDAAEACSKTLQTVVDDQLIADVPVGIYLSGGLDSSTLTAFAAQRRDPVNTFCLAFGEPTDENEDARVVSERFNTRHTDVRLEQNPLTEFRKAVYHMEEPKVNCLQGYLLSGEARKHQKVVLGGLGGDEVFGGYDVYAIGAWLDLLRFSPKGICASGGAIFRSLLNLFPGLQWDLARRGADLMRALRRPLDAYLLLRNSWDHDRSLVHAIYRKNPLNTSARPVKDHFAGSFPGNGLFSESFMRFELRTKMVDDFLANEDRMSMAHGLESRVPFLDRRIVEMVYSFPVAWKIQRGQRKILLKKMVSHRLPARILSKKKHGFTFNPVIQFQKDLKGFASEYLSRERVENSGIFNYAYIERVLNSNPHPSLRWHYFLLWKIAGYHLWEDIFIRNGGKVESENS